MKAVFSISTGLHGSDGPLGKKHQMNATNHRTNHQYNEEIMTTSNTHRQSLEADAACLNKIAVEFEANRDEAEKLRARETDKVKVPDRSVTQAAVDYAEMCRGEGASRNPDRRLGLVLPFERSSERAMGRALRSKIRPKECKTAADLVKRLDLSKPTWDAAGRWGWCFRGQDCDESLIPSALRDDPSWPVETLGALPKALREFYAVEQFLHAADRSGLAIPHDAPELRARPFRAAFGADFSMEVLSCWPSDQIASMVALAQHYGIPTRLLDWTFHPLVAAYFAAYRLAKEACNETSRRRYDPSKHMVIWALNLFAIPPHVPGRVDGVSRFAIVRAPQATNPNLAAQAGLFTVDREADREADGRRALEDLLPAMLKKSATSLFRKFRLPHTEARRLLRLVGLRGVTAATVFPGHKGVADSLYEEIIWEK